MNFKTLPFFYLLTASLYSTTTDDMINVLKKTPAHIPAKFAGLEYASGTNGFQKLVSNLDQKITNERTADAQALAADAIAAEQKKYTTCENHAAQLQEQLTKLNAQNAQDIASLQKKLADAQKHTEQELEKVRTEAQNTLKERNDTIEALKKQIEALTAQPTPQEETKIISLAELNTHVQSLKTITQQLQEIQPEQVRTIKTSGLISAAWNLVKTIREKLEESFAK